MFLGLLTGAYEAAILKTYHRQDGLTAPDIGPLIFVVAPLADMALFAVVGLVIGLLDITLTAIWSAGERFCLATFLAFVLTYTISVSFLLQARWNDPWRPDWLRYELLCGAAVLAVMVVVVYRLKIQMSSVFPASQPLWRTSLGRGIVVGTSLLLGVVFLYTTFRFEYLTPVHAATVPSKHPYNVVLITLDTVRADHLSAYGYSRPTSPNLDRLATRGVLFENAIVASSFTLPSHESIFTGMLPHEHGANWFLPMSNDYQSLAEILSANGYETAGFTANYFYGLDGWGMERGFEFYDDDTTELRHNLSATLLGTRVLQPFFSHWIEEDRFDRRDAPEINRAALRWLRHHPDRPFFLFLNYFDAHDPYLPPPPYNRRFGEGSKKLNRFLGSLLTDHAPSGTTEADRTALIAGYDNGIAYLDVQVAQFLAALDQLPSGPNTYVIITSGHCDSFGEHGTYRHGLNLYRELVHVPLIIYGPGIPAGRRIPNVVPTRKLFATTLDLGLPGRLIAARYGLRGYWEAGSPPPGPDMAISELASFNISMSVMTDEWQFLRDSRGKEELYRWLSDPEEKNDLAGSPEGIAVRGEIREKLYQRIRSSPRPWRGREYLAALDQPDHPFILVTARDPRRPLVPPQYLLGQKPPEPKAGAREEERELIQSIPYQ